MSKYVGKKYMKGSSGAANKNEIMHPTIQMALLNTPSNQVKSGEGSSRDTKGECKEMGGVEWRLRRKKRKKRLIDIKCEYCN